MVFLFCVKKLLNQEKIYFCDIVNNSLVFSPHISCLFEILGASILNLSKMESTEHACTL